MKTIPCIAWALLLLALCPVYAFAQGGTSNKGTEFWTVWMNHIDGAGGNGSQMNLYITGDNNTTGTVSLADGSYSQPFTVTANKVTIVPMPVNAYLSDEGTFLKGIHITAAKNVVVYAHIYFNARSGATLVLPVNAMGKDYYSINYTQNPSTAYSVFCVVATEDNTTVDITPTANLTSGHAANTKFTINLKKGQVYQGLASQDLTGTRIKSVSNGTEGCKKIAVFSGSSWLAITCVPGKKSADNLYQQVYPTSAWGKNFVTAPLANRAYDAYRIIYSDPTAVVQLNGTIITRNQINNGFYYEFNATEPTSITSDKPIQVVQYAVTQGSNADCTGNDEKVGDPEMIYLAPIEQGLDHVTLYSTDKQNIVQSYINVIIPSTAVASFKLDGASYTSFKPVAANPTYAYAQIPVGSGVANGTHNISASSPFNAIAYGFGNVESYGYAAGTDLKNLTEFIELKDPQTDKAMSSGCAGVKYKPLLSIPYQTNSIKWDLKDGSAPVTVTNPVLKGTVVKGNQTLYMYEYPSVITYGAAGSYSIVATVFNPISDDCGSNEEIEFDYSLFDMPGAKFTAPTATCPGTEINFTDQSDTKGATIKSWAWDFGDASNVTLSTGHTASVQNPKHTYSQAGDYTVTLTVTNDNGCASSYQQIIHVSVPPKASFTASIANCVGSDITFTDTSAPANTTGSKWTWNFNDGNTITRADNLPFTHQFTAAGTYNVSLTVSNSAGCVSDVFTLPVTVTPLPVVDFSMPDICVSDAFAQFTNKTTIADNSDNQLTYSWNFGDPNATPSNPNTSTLANPKHKYTQPRDTGNPYNVTLTVTSKSGCQVTKTQNFTVNGDALKAAFTVENSAALCSSEDVIFNNQSTVNYGSITKIVWYFDYNNHPGDATVYTKDQFPADGRYHHNYGLFYIPATQNYAVKMEAYSGQTCVSVTAVQNITVRANPSVTLSTIGAICKEAGPVLITQSPNNGVTGTGVFSGPGVSATGLFNPALVNAGTYIINYVFTATNGCNYSASQQVTVYPAPIVSIGADLHVLEGGKAVIKATASGASPLTYKWTLLNGGKAIGLDHDDVLQPTASPTGDIAYLLTVTSANGCSATATVNVSLLRAPVVPNTFTPNNDGVNDRWDIKYLESYPNCTVDVYNRYGEKLYSSIGYPTAWDGTCKGAELPVGTYYYIINPKNGRKVISGSITIIR